jgi:glycosyltransferase involved in cell wall biosynthesis
MVSISVALATYNGARFLREQLKSLADQSHLPDQLVVGDDGSSDGTMEILKEFRKRAPFPVHIHRNETNLGYARNFLATAQRCNGDWIAFCDQDDVWLPNKLADAASEIERTLGCCMVLQNAWLCDSALASRNHKFPDRLRTGLHGSCEQYGFWVWPGFLKTIRSDMLNLLGDEEMPRSWFPRESHLTHDKWTCIIANAIGGVVVLEDPAALYRRHDAALTGDYNRQTLGERVTKARSVSADHYDFLADVAGECARYMDRLSQRTKNPKWASALRENSYDFLKLQKTQRLRSQLYAGHRFVNRLAPFFGILREGGYFGAPFTAMGSLSAAKDAVRVVFGNS